MDAEKITRNRVGSALWNRRDWFSTESETPGIIPVVVRRNGLPPVHVSVHVSVRPSMFAENLVDLLEQKNLVSPALVAGLRERISQSPQPIPAAVFAERLVERQVLTPTLADELLRQLRVAEKTPDVPPPIQPKPLIPVLDLRDYKDPVEPSPPPLPPPLPNSLPRPQTAAEGSTSYPSLSLEARKRFLARKTVANPSDSKLILFGGAGLFFLFVIGFFLYGSLYRRSADTMFGIADQSYDNGSYSQAIIGYTDFLRAFPNHSSASPARIRRALARIRLLVDAKSDWSKALETATDELKDVENVPTFYEESRAEIGVLLPKIAVALAADAVERASQLHADRAEEALTLIDKYIPRSRQPSDQLIEIRAKIGRVRRALVKLDKLDDAEKALQQRLQATTWTKSTFDECFALLDTLHGDYPELVDEPKFTALLRSVTENAHRAIEPIVDERFHSTQPTASEPAADAGLFTSLFYRKHYSDAPIPGGQTVVVCADGTVYGLRASDGVPLWSRANVLNERVDWGTAPVFQTVSPTKQLLQPSVLLLDSRHWVLLLLDAATGEPIWNVAVGEPFRISNIVSDEDHSTVALTTETGELCILSFAKDVDVRRFRLPQPTSVAAFIDPEKKVVYQLADRETLYVLSLEDPTTSRSVHTAHWRSTIRTAPVRFGTNLLLVFQTGIRQCSLDVLDVGQNFAVRQRIPIPALVDTVPEIDGAFAVLTADNGETFLFESVDGELRKIAEGSAGGDTAPRGIVRFVLPIGKNVWVADRQLMRFESQLAQARLLPNKSVKQNIVTLQPLRRIGKTLFHAFRSPSHGGVGIAAIATDSTAVLWETEFSDAVVTEPRIKDNVATIYTASGKAYTLNLADEKEKFLGQPTTMLPPGTFDVSLADVLPMNDGFDAWVPRWTAQNRTVMIYDPTATDATRFRTLMLPIPPAMQPIALDGRLLVPLADGQIALFDTKKGTPIAIPFVSTIAADRPPLWTPPVATPNSKEFLIVNNRPDENNQVVLYRVALVEDGEARLIEKGKLTLVRPIWSPIAVAGSVAGMVDDRNAFLIVNLENWEPRVTVNLPAPCVWGPCALGNGFVFATADSTLRFVDSDGERWTCPSPIPIGKPLLDGDTASFNSVDGKFWSVDLKDGKRGLVIETGVPVSVGPIRVGGKTFFCGRDGTVRDSVFGIRDSDSVQRLPTQLEQDQ